MSTHDRKTLVIGYDGASPSIINKWIDILPTFRRFKERGILGETTPPVPAQTPVAWSTFMTGKNPGNHGIFSFAYRETGTYERRIIDTEILTSKTLWRILSDAGKRVGVINVPMCDVENVNGFIIPGFVSKNEGIPHPSAVATKVKKRFGVDRLTGDLEIDTLEKAQSEPDFFFERVNQITDEMAEICLYLIQEEDWDFFMPVFMGMDRIHHFFWRNIDSTHHSFQDNNMTELARRFYQKIDKITARFLQSADENTLVIVLSDHGFCPVYKEVVVNNYLEEAGFLAASSGKIDLENSKAVSYGYGDVWLNVKQREPKGLISKGEDYENTREEITAELMKLEIDGERPVKSVKKREDLWWGAYLDRAPDLTVIFHTGYQAARRPEIMNSNSSKRYVNDNPRWSGGHDGTHDPSDVPGILGILSPATKAGSELRVHLMDVAPTILKWMGVTIPNDMDGKPFI